LDNIKSKKEINKAYGLIFGDRMKSYKTIRDYLLIILFVIMLRLFIITPVQVNGDSMLNTLHHSDVMILNIIGYRIKDVKRFDIIVFKYNDEPLIKRVIGLPGEFVEYRNNKLYINGVLVDDPVLDEITSDFNLSEALGYDTVPNNSYFVLGDNRNNSTDSRYIGFINKRDIMGKTNLVVFPFNRLGFVR
jgi:signal peptidase I